ncbi:MAG TPA: hypothetical protein VG013_34150 [Gemmataceae bacterium]|jgi:hypothetical protein|nr:hypothetical protein [Gemmataceae bacterium]
MDAQDYLQRAEAAGRVKWLAKYEGGKCLGQVVVLILDEAEGIAVLLDDGTLPAEACVRAGHIVKFVHSPLHGGPVMASSANLRGDRQKQRPAAQAPPATPAPPPAAELEAARPEPRSSKGKTVTGPAPQKRRGRPPKGGVAQ